MIDKIQGFKNACVECLDNFSLGQLRNYGRAIGVDVPTKKKKGELITEIVGVLAGEIPPIERSKRGAPVKDEYVDPSLEQAIAKQRYVWLAGIEPPVRLTYFESKMMNPNVLMVQSDDNSMTYEQYQAQPIYCGQLQMIDDVPTLVDMQGDLEGERLIVSIELIRQYGLRDGDIITCHAHEKMGVWAAKNILTINSIVAGTETRFIFDEESVVYPSQRIRFPENVEQSPAAKYINYVLPLGYGQRCLVSSAPKAGKSVFLRDVAKTLSGYTRGQTLFVLLIDQSPELISSYQSFMSPENLVATSYDDEPERHIFAAEFLLKRAKRFAENGKNVVLIIDSLTKLAKSYNETRDSEGGKTMPCGLEFKTLHYLKKYFGSARAFSEEGSLTLIGTASFGTGDAMDDVIYSEASSLANAEIRLSDSLAKARLFPAVDVSASYTDALETLLNDKEKAAEEAFRKKEATPNGEAVRELLLKSANFDEFYRRVMK